MEWMPIPSKFPFKRPEPPAAPALDSRVDELREAARLIPPTLLAERVSAQYLELGPDRGEIHLPLFDSPVTVTYPNLTAFSNNDDILPASVQALLLYHLVTSNGAPLVGKWVSFADLLDGRMYAQAFQGYSGDIVRDTVSDDLKNLKTACLVLGGQPLELGSASFTFSALPRVPLLLTFWLGDEDFPSSCKVLFDASAREHLPIDVCAILGSMLTGKIVKKLKST